MALSYLSIDPSTQQWLVAPATGESWRDYILRSLSELETYDARRPETAPSDSQAVSQLINEIGYGRLKQLIPAADQQDPRIAEFLNQTLYSNTAKDHYSFLGDQFSTALALLLAAGGGAAAFGAFAPEAGAAAGAGAGAGAGTAGGETIAAALPETFGGNVALATGEAAGPSLIAATPVTPVAASPTIVGGSSLIPAGATFVTDAGFPLLEVGGGAGALGGGGAGALGGGGGASTGPAAGSSLAPELEGGTFGAQPASSWSSSSPGFLDYVKAGYDVLKGQPNALVGESSTLSTLKDIYDVYKAIPVSVTSGKTPAAAPQLPAGMRQSPTGLAPGDSIYHPIFLKNPRSLWT